MKITVEEEPSAVTLRLEGRVIGPLVEELDRTWKQVASSLGSKKLLVDLNGVIHMDPHAKEVLAEIYRATGAGFVANTPLTQYFADEAQGRNGKKPSKEGK